MIEVNIIYHLSNGYVVDYGGTLYILMDQDILFVGNKTYTLPNKLTHRYNNVRQSDKIR
jgi:hypothetical protein